MKENITVYSIVLTSFTLIVNFSIEHKQVDRVKRIWYLSPMRAAKVQASLRIRAVSPEPSLLAHTSSESRGTFRQKARSLAPLNGWACAVKMCHGGMLEDTNSLVAAQVKQHFYGMPNVALFDIFIFLLYILGFVFNIWPFLFYIL